MRKDRHNHKHFNNSNSQKNKSNQILPILRGLILGTIIYTLLYIIVSFLLKELFGQYDFFKVKFVYILITGLFLSIFSRIIFDLIKKKKVYIGSNVFVFWAITYGLSVWLFESLWNIILREFSITNVTPILEFIFIGFGITLLIKLVKRIEFGIKSPSQILMGVLLMFCGILFFRFSGVIFGTYWPEGMAWSWLFGLALIIGGFLIVVAWWRNNVSMFTTRHTIHLKKH